MAVVLLYSLGGQGCQEAGQLDEAIVQYELGNEVIFIHCDKGIGGCRDNYLFCSTQCRICEHFQKKRIKKYFGNREIKVFSISDFYSDDIKNAVTGFSPSYSDINSLKEVTYKDIPIGYGLVSSYVSATRNLDPILDNKTIMQFNKILSSEVLVIEMLNKAVQRFMPDLIVFHNGRHWTYKPALGVAQINNISYLCTEFLHMPDGSEGKDYFYNAVAHDKKAIAQHYLDFWDSIKDEQYKTKIGKSFFENKRACKYAGDTVYVIGQEKGLLPSNFNPEKKNIVIFNSSQDEMFSISKEVDRDNLFDDPIEGIKKIVNHYEGCEDIHIYLRVHPHLDGIPYSYHTELYKIKGSNFTIIPANSKISSYTLLDMANTIIVFGSTMGVEANYQGKKVINLSWAFYDCMDIAYRPQSEKELWEMIDSSQYGVKNKIDSIKAGFYWMSYDHPKLKYVNLITYRFSVWGRRQEAHSYTTLFGSSKLYWLLFKLVNLTERLFLNYKITTVPLKWTNRSLK